jgi:hypothetical protein
MGISSILGVDAAEEACLEIGFEARYWFPELELPALLQPCLVTREPSKFHAEFIIREKYSSLSIEADMLL